MDRAAALRRPEPEVVAPEDRPHIVEARRVLDECRKLQEMFETEGWSFVMEKLRQLDANAKLGLERSATTMEQVREARGRLSILRELLLLEGDTELDLAEAQRVLNEEDENAR